MLKLLFCKVADVFDRDRQYLFAASVQIDSKGNSELRFPMEVPIEEMEVEGYVTFYDDVEGLVTHWCRFSNLIKIPELNQISMNATVTDFIDQVQRRQDLKSSIRFKIEIDYTDAKGKLRFCQGEVENISAGGVFFTSEHKFSLGDSVVLRLSEISPRLFTPTQVLRIQSLDDWESSPWYEKKEEPVKAPVRPPKPEGQNIFSFVRKRQAQLGSPSPSTVEDEAPRKRLSFEPEEESAEEELSRVVEEDVGGDTIRYGYGCQFIKIGHTKENLLRRFVFEQERQRLQITR